MDLEQRRDHLAAMLQVIAKDLETPQTKQEQSDKATGTEDGNVDAETAATSHGTDRAAIGYTPTQMVSEFRSLRASVLRLWSEAQRAFDRDHVEEITRFNEAIDQLLAESIARYTQDVDRVQDLFVGTLGHDLQNPLGAIMMTTSTMMSQEGPDWRHARAAARILSSGNRMEHLVGDLLDFTRSRLSTGIPITPTEVDLEALCRQAVEEMAAFHPNSSFQLDSTGDLRGRWDGPRIAQALSNLLGNAIQHGLAERPIQVTLRGESKRVVVRVHNKGPSIPTRHLQDIFDPFRKLAPAAAQGSRTTVGLGLYIVRAIVTAHGGTIDVAPTADGTTFTIDLPRA